jgi:hypothetical protein
MSGPTRRATDPDQDVTVSRELLAQMDEATTDREHWKILFTATAEVSRATEDSSDFCELEMCHSVTTIEATTPMMNKS